MNTVLAAASGLFFASSVAGWLCAHIQTVKAAQASSKAYHLGLQLHQAVHANHGLAEANAKLHSHIEELEGGGDLPGDEWKHGTN